MKTAEQRGPEVVKLIKAHEDSTRLVGEHTKLATEARAACHVCPLQPRGRRGFADAGRRSSRLNRTWTAGVASSQVQLTATWSDWEPRAALLVTVGSTGSDRS